MATHADAAVGVSADCEGHEADALHAASVAADAGPVPCARRPDWGRKQAACEARLVRSSLSRRLSSQISTWKCANCRVLNDLQRPECVSCGLAKSVPASVSVREVRVLRIVCAGAPAELAVIGQGAAGGSSCEHARGKGAHRGKAQSPAAIGGSAPSVPA